MNFKIILSVAEALKSILIPAVAHVASNAVTDPVLHEKIVSGVENAINSTHTGTVVGHIVSEIAKGNIHSTFSNADLGAAALSYAQTVNMAAGLSADQVVQSAFKAGAIFASAHAAFSLSDAANAAVNAAPAEQGPVAANDTKSIAGTVVNDAVGIAEAAATGGAPAAALAAAEDVVQVAHDYLQTEEAPVAKAE